MAKFKTRARTVDMLGRQQIAGIPTAISELFKNAHDAYSDKAEVDYFREEDLFILRDDGIGMTEEDFVNRWLAIGTESKLDAGIGLSPPPKPQGKKERPLLGEKGIGRLAIAAIGPQVLILTRAERNHKLNDTVAAFINWRIFETPGINLDEIEIPVAVYLGGRLPSQEDVRAMVELFKENIDRLTDSIKPLLKKKITSELEAFDIDPIRIDQYLKTLSTSTLTENGHGTQFYISPTNETLVADMQGDTDDEASPLVKTLIGFNNTMASDQGGSAQIDSKHGPRIAVSFRDHRTAETYVNLIGTNEFFTPEEFKSADHHFKGRFNEYGGFEGTVAIYSNDPIEYSLPWPDAKGTPIECGSFKLNLAYVQGAAKASLLSKEEWTKITRKLNRIGGLYIYRDGIRVLPYGNSDYDFLELEQSRSKRASTYFFSYRRMFGYIEISKEKNSELSEKAGREGFRENKAYRQFRAILKHFFLQAAVDFFREGGTYSEAYLEAKAEQERLEQVRKEREEKAKQERRKLAAQLDKFFLDTESGKPQTEADELITYVTSQLAKASTINNVERANDEVSRISASIRSRIDDLRQQYTVSKPKELGISPSLRRDLELYRKELRRLDSEIFIPTLKKVDELIAGFSNSPRSRISRLAKWEQRFKGQIESSRKSFDADVREIATDLEKVREQILQFIQGEADELERVIKEVLEELNQVLISKDPEQRLKEEQYRWEASVEDAVIKRRQALENIRTQLKGLVISDTGGAAELIEALEEEALALRERSEDDIELVQLGMAIAVVNHEFDNTIRAIRENLRRLKAWADINPDLRELYDEIRSDYEHLDGYLTLFTPLQRRLYRTKIEIRGASIAKYLRALFSERLKERKVEVKDTERFAKMKIMGYPSTFYPVFINLVDNALYWLQYRSSEPRTIELDVKGNTIIVSDNGPGVPLRDKDAIFQRGFTRKPGGRGMGLKISRDVLAKEGYELTLANSLPESGAVFEIKQIYNPEKE